MSDNTRLVVVTTGFGLWESGRHVSSARWADVATVRAVKRAGGARDGIALVVSLADGRDVELHDGLPGWDAFLAAAPGALPGMPAVTSWHPTVAHSGFPAGATALLFERARRPGA